MKEEEARPLVESHPLKTIVKTIKNELEKNEMGELRLWVSDRHADFQAKKGCGYPVAYNDPTFDDTLRIFLGMCKRPDLYQRWKKVYQAHNSGAKSFEKK